MQEGLIPDLNEAHHSRIRITLTLLDEALVKFEEWAQGREVRSILYREKNTLEVLATRRRNWLIIWTPRPIESSNIWITSRHCWPTPAL